MRSPFESVTRVAIEELVQQHAKSSKFGYVLTPEGYRDLCEDLYGLFVTSRSLKDAGDRFLRGAQQETPRSQATRGK